MFGKIEKWIVSEQDILIYYSKVTSNEMQIIGLNIISYDSIMLLQL